MEYPEETHLCHGADRTQQESERQPYVLAEVDQHNIFPTNTLHFGLKENTKNRGN
jgi:hypothetical protein